MPRPLSSLNLALNRGDGNGMLDPSTIPNLSWWIDPSDESRITYDVGSEIEFLGSKEAGASSTTRLQQEVSPIARPGLFTRTDSGIQWCEGDLSTQRCLRVALITETAVNFGSGEMHVFVTAKREFTDTTTNKGILQKGGTTGFYQIVMRQPTDGDGAIRFAIGDGTDTASIISGTGLINNNDYVLLEMVRDNTASEFRAYVNGTQVGTAQSTTLVGSTDDATLELFVGCQPSGSSTQAPWDGLIGEILFYKRALDASEQGAVRNYMLSKWGIV